MFRALANRNYRLFFAGESISMIGNWMQSMVQGWLVYRLTGSAFWLGMIAFCSQFSAFLVSPIAGVLADHLDRRRTLIVVETAGMIQAFALAALFFSGHIEIWHIAILAAALGVCNSFEMITRHSFAVDLVGKADLPSAISLNSIIINSSRVVGPAIAGLVVHWTSEGWCFVFNGISYFAVIGSLVAMRLSGPATKPTQGRAFASRRAQRLGENIYALVMDFKAALLYLRLTPEIRRLLLVSLFVSFLGFPVINLLPVFAKDVLGGDAATLASLTGLAGTGGVLGALILTWKIKRGLRRFLTLALAVIGLSLILLGSSHFSPGTHFSALLLGFFMMGIMPLINTRIQQRVDDRMRGRILSLYTMTFLGATPIGSLMQGWLSDHFGAGRVTLGTGACFVCLGLGLLYQARAFRVKALA